MEGNLIGNGELEISSLARLEIAGADEISFVEKQETLAETKAGCLLVPENFESKLSCALIQVKNPKLAFAKGAEVAIPDSLIAENLIFKLQKVNTDNSILLGIKESNELMDYVTIKAYKFPFINLLWLGVLITATGIIISMVRRIQLNRVTSKTL